MRRSNCACGINCYAWSLGGKCMHAVECRGKEACLAGCMGAECREHGQGRRSHGVARGQEVALLLRTALQNTRVILHEFTLRTVLPSNLAQILTSYIKIHHDIS